MSQWYDTQGFYQLSYIQQSLIRILEFKHNIQYVLNKVFNQICVTYSNTENPSMLVIWAKMDLKTKKILLANEYTL